jgi:anti-sigma factor RsiW
MDHAEVRTLMLDARRGRLDPEVARAVAEHLTGCDDCRAIDAVDASLSRALDRLPAPTMPPSFTHDLARKWAPDAPSPAKRVRSIEAKAGAFVLASLVATWLFVSALDARRHPSGVVDPLVAEAVNDHLRVLYADRPVEIASGGIHQVKPWFAGRLDFAPVMPFAGDDDFPLEGGSVAYVVDRKAAAFLFKRRLHTISVFVFRADGLAFPPTTRAIGRVLVSETTTRGFHALLWRERDLAYAAVSDVDPNDLAQLVAKIAP